MPRSHRTTLDLVAGPPPEVLDEIDAAWERAQALLDDEYELSVDFDGLPRRVWGDRTSVLAV
jgi:hypothetical protein